MRVVGIGIRGLLRRTGGNGQRRHHEKKERFSHEKERKKEICSAYASMVMVPTISLWPTPHGMLQKNLNVPATSVGSVTLIVWPGVTIALMPSSGEEKPCVPAIPVSWMITFSPFFAVIMLGVNTQVFVVMAMTRGSVATGGGVAAALLLA